MTVEAEITQDKHKENLDAAYIDRAGVKDRPLTRRARIFRMVEVFVSNHPGLKSSVVAALAERTKELLELPHTNVADISRLSNSITNTIRGMNGQQRR